MILLLKAQLGFINGRLVIRRIGFAIAATFESKSNLSDLDLERAN